MPAGLWHPYIIGEEDMNQWEDSGKSYDCRVDGDGWEPRLAKDKGASRREEQRFPFVLSLKGHPGQLGLSHFPKLSVLRTLVWLADHRLSEVVWHEICRLGPSCCFLKETTTFSLPVDSYCCPPGCVQEF